MTGMAGDGFANPEDPARYSFDMAYQAC